MGSWTYGIAQTKEGLMVGEVYFHNDNKAMGFVPLKWGDLKTKKTQAIFVKDLNDQLTAIFNGKKKQFRFVFKEE